MSSSNTLDLSKTSGYVTETETRDVWQKVNVNVEHGNIFLQATRTLFLFP